MSRGWACNAIECTQHCERGEKGVHNCATLLRQQPCTVYILSPRMDRLTRSKQFKLGKPSSSSWCFGASPLGTHLYSLLLHWVKSAGWSSQSSEAIMEPASRSKQVMTWIFKSNRWGKTVNKTHLSYTGLPPWAKNIYIYIYTLQLSLLKHVPRLQQRV